MGAGRYGRRPELIAEDFGGGKLKQQGALSNFANPDKITTPDNLRFSEKLRTLLIDEDGNTHVNDFLWAYNVDTKKLSRLCCRRRPVRNRQACMLSTKSMAGLTS